MHAAASGGPPSLYCSAVCSWSAAAMVSCSKCQIYRILGQKDVLMSLHALQLSFPFKAHKRLGRVGFAERAEQVLGASSERSATGGSGLGRAGVTGDHSACPQQHSPWGWRWTASCTQAAQTWIISNMILHIRKHQLLSLMRIDSLSYKCLLSQQVQVAPVLGILAVTCTFQYCELLIYMSTIRS